MTKPAIAYSYAEAAAATGFSEDYVRRAHRAGDLVGRYPTVNKKRSIKPVFLPSDLEAWVTGQAAPPPAETT